MEKKLKRKMPFKKNFSAALRNIFYLVGMQRSVTFHTPYSLVWKSTFVIECEPESYYNTSFRKYIFSTYLLLSWYAISYAKAYTCISNVSFYSRVTYYTKKLCFCSTRNICRIWNLDSPILLHIHIYTIKRNNLLLKLCCEIFILDQLSYLFNLNST